MIPVFEPDVHDEDIEAVSAAMRRGELSGNFGKSLAEFEDRLASFVGCKHGIAVSSGTTALHLAIASLDLAPGDEVLVSASTNIATALAVVHNGGTVVPVDSEPTTWNLDLDQLDRLVSGRTKAIIPVHLFGHPVDMQKLMAWANDAGIAVIEDCAEALGAESRGAMAGSFGAAACFSFYSNKHITTGEGGMVTTNDSPLAERMRLLRNLAFTKPRFRHDRLGFNFRMTGMQAALGVSQLNRIDAIIKAKRDLALRYQAALTDISGLQLPGEQPWAKNVYWMYAVCLTDRASVSRDKLTTKLAEAGIETRTFFCPMNLQPCLQGRMRAAPCPVAEQIWANGFYLPSSSRLSASEVENIATAISRTLN